MRLSKLTESPCFRVLALKAFAEDILHVWLYVRAGLVFRLGKHAWRAPARAANPRASI